MRRPARFLIVAALVLVSVTPMVALELRVSALQTSSSRVSLVLELRDLLRDKFLETIQQGRAVFLQMQAEVWEDRRIADRLTLGTALRIGRYLDSATAEVNSARYTGLQIKSGRR